MKITKKELLLSLRKPLNEMPMNFDSPDRPNPDVERDLAAREHPLKKINFPKNVDQPHNNFEELLASERYQQIVGRVRDYLDLPPLQGERSVGTLIGAMMDAQRQIEMLEDEHLDELAQLAVQLVSKELGVPEGSINYDAKIERPDNQGFIAPQPGDMEPEEVDLEKEIYQNLDELNLERAKRRFINAMLAGTASKGHYIYHYAKDKLEDITGSNQIIPLYGAAMSAADAFLWQGSNRMLGTGGGGGTPPVAGSERVFPNEKPPRIVARAINFPILVHELIKGTYEVIAALHGQPKDKELKKQVIKLEDNKHKEIWDFRLGPAIWNRFESAFPEETIVDEDKANIQLIFFQRIVAKPAKEFLVFMKELLSNSENGKRMMQLLYEMISGEINDYDYKMAMSEFDKDLKDATDNTDDDSLKDFLNDLGIDLPPTQ